MKYIKQTDPAFAAEPYDAIQTDGCLWRCLLHGSEIFSGDALTAGEIRYAYHYSIPDFMEDYRQPHQDRCFIKVGGHPEIMRIGFYILGNRHVTIKYLYRRDCYTSGDKLIIGRGSDLFRCNFFLAKCKMPTFNHFYVSDMKGTTCIWNPGQSFSDELLSVRGFYVER